MPKIKGDHLDAVVNLRIEKGLLKDLERIAKDNGLPRAALMRLVLKGFVNKKGKKTVKIGGD